MSSLMPEQSEGKNHTRKINVFSVLHTIFLHLGAEKLTCLPCRGKKSALFDSLVEKIIFDVTDNFSSFKKNNYLLKENVHIFVYCIPNSLGINLGFLKPTAYGRFINYFSSHPLQQKKNIVYNLIDRAILLSHKSFYRTNLKRIEELLINNDYPSSFSDEIIKIRMNKIKYNFCSNSNTRNNSFCPYKRQKKVCLPFSNNNYIIQNLKKL